jgi:two-component system NtrC family response regulator
MAERRLIEPSDLELEPPHDTMPDLDLRAARLRAEREVIQMALARSSYTLASAAKLLGISRPTLYGLMEVHGIAPKPQVRGSGAEFGDIAEEPGAVGPVPRYERG